jgi:hypothetical protein
MWMILVADHAADDLDELFSLADEQSELAVNPEFSRVTHSKPPPKWYLCGLLSFSASDSFAVEGNQMWIGSDISPRSQISL